MDASALDACSGQRPVSLSDELGSFLDEDLHRLVAGAVTIGKHLLQFAVLVLTLTACVVLYCCMLAWICLFWAQTRLFDHTSVFLHRCMSKTSVIGTVKLGGRIATSSATNPKVSSTSKSKNSLLEQSATNHPYSGLAAEFHHAVETQKHITPKRNNSCSGGTHKSIHVDDDAILRKILLREEEIEAEIHELATSVTGMYDSVTTVNEITGLQHEQDDCTFVEPAENQVVVDGSVGSDAQPSDEIEEHGNKRVFTFRPPQTATFKLTTSKKAVKPRVDFAEQLKEKKARDQMAFVHSMNANSIVSTTKRNAENSTTHAEHLKSVWKDEDVATPSHSNNSAVVGKSLPHSTRATASVPKGTKRQPAQPPTQTIRRPLPFNASGQHSAVPPHVRTSLEAKAKRAAAAQLTLEAKVKENKAVPTNNFFALLSDDTLSANDLGKPQRNDETSVICPAVESETGVTTVQQPPSSPGPDSHLPSQSNVDSDVSAQKAQAEQPADLIKSAGEQVKERRAVYTLDVLKATKSLLTEAEESTISGKISAAALLIAHHTRSGNRSSASPIDKRATGRWEFCNRTKEQPPGSRSNRAQARSFANDFETSSQADDTPPILQECRVSSMSVATKADLVDEDSEAINVRMPDPRHNYQAAPPISSVADLQGLDFGTAAILDKSPLKTGSPKSTSTLPIAAGQLPFVVPIAVEKSNENVTPQQPTTFGLASHDEFTAFKPYAPGPLQSHASQYDQPPPRSYPPHYYWTEPHSMPGMVYAPHGEVDPVYTYNDVHMFDSSRHSFTGPILQPAEPRTVGTTFEQAFPPLGAAQPVQNNTSILKPPGLDVARPNAQAAFDALLPAVEVPPKRSPNLEKFITVATTASASLGGSHGELSDHDVPPFAARDGPLFMTKSPHMEDDLTSPKLPKVHLPDTPYCGEVREKKSKSAERRLVRENLKDAWWDREEARKTLVGCFSLDSANALKQSTMVYLEKRDVLRSLMGSGVLNGSDAAMFPEFGLMDLALPKVKALSVEEMRSRKRESQTVAAEAADTIPANPPAQPEEVQSDQFVSVLKDMENAQRHRNQATTMQHAPSGMTHETWVKSLARANKQYCRKRKKLIAAYPAGLPTELELRFPQVSLVG